MRGYYVDKIEVSWLGLDLKEGLADGSFLTPARTNPSYTQKETANGNVIRSFRPGTSGTMTGLVNQTSNTHLKLSEIFEQDRLTKNQVGDMVITDVVSGKKWVYKNAYLQSQPDDPLAMEESDLSWVWGFESVTLQRPDVNGSVVGN